MHTGNANIVSESTGPTTLMGGITDKLISRNQALEMSSDQLEVYLTELGRTLAQENSLNADDALIHLQNLTQIYAIPEENQRLIEQQQEIRESLEAIIDKEYPKIGSYLIRATIARALQANIQATERQIIANHFLDTIISNSYKTKTREELFEVLAEYEQALSLPYNPLQIFLGEVTAFKIYAQLVDATCTTKAKQNTQKEWELVRAQTILTFNKLEDTKQKSLLLQSIADQNSPLKNIAPNQDAITNLLIYLYNVENIKNYKDEAKPIDFSSEKLFAKVLINSNKETQNILAPLLAEQIKRKAVEGANNADNLYKDYKTENAPLKTLMSKYPALNQEITKTLFKHTTKNTKKNTAPTKRLPTTKTSGLKTIQNRFGQDKKRDAALIQAYNKSRAADQQQSIEVQTSSWASSAWWPWNWNFSSLFRKWFTKAQNNQPTNGANTPTTAPANGNISTPNNVNLETASQATNIVIDSNNNAPATQQRPNSPGHRSIGSFESDGVLAVHGPSASNNSTRSTVIISPQGRIPSATTFHAISAERKNSSISQETASGASTATTPKSTSPSSCHPILNAITHHKPGLDVTAQRDFDKVA